MKKTIITFLLASCYLASFSQIMDIPFILGSKKETPATYDAEHLQFYQTALPFGFSAYSLADSATIALLKEKTIYKVELVYSGYKKNKQFSQEQLNALRLAQLQQQLPFVFENNAIEWVLVEQQETDHDKASQLFHGFVFYSREPGIITKDGTFIKIGTSEEIDIIKSMLGDTMPIGYKCLLPIPTDAVVTDTVIKEINETSKGYEYTGKYYPRNKHKKEKGIRYKRASIWRRKKEQVEVLHTSHRIDTTYLRLGKVYTKDFREIIGTADGVTYRGFQADSVVFKTLRKHYGEKVLLVEDVTGSMYPYLAQTFAWRRMFITATRGKNYAFFNDGDSRPDGPIGNSYGVYYIHSDSIDVVENCAYSTMRKGGGGGCPENNVEASIRALDFSKDKINRVLMVADNYAPVRDIEIFDKLLEKKIPVDVIVCGAYGGVNYQYINIARKTGGTLYTMEEELTQLASLTEGQIITIGGQKFVITGGELKLVR